MRTSIFVISTHLFILLFAAFFHPPKSKMTPHPSVKVQTVVFKKEETPTKTPTASSPKVTAKSAEKPVAKSPPKPESKPKPKQEAKPTTKPTVKKETSTQSNPNREKLLSMVEESLQKLDAPASHNTAPRTPTKKISTLASETLSFTANYQGDLIAYLQHLLTLPEKGSVKIELTLNRNGAVQKLSIQNASNEHNRSYIEAQIPTLTFPSFGSNFKGEGSHTFKITLTSEETH